MTHSSNKIVGTMVAQITIFFVGTLFGMAAGIVVLLLTSQNWLILGAIALLLLVHAVFDLILISCLRLIRWIFGYQNNPSKAKEMEPKIVDTNRRTLLMGLVIGLLVMLLVIKSMTSVN